MAFWHYLGNFVAMKHFRTITIAILATITLLFAANVGFLIRLYNSIKEQYIDNVEQCLRRADLIELIERLTAEGFGEDGIIEISLGLQKSPVGSAQTRAELLENNYSQGYRRMDRQLISIVTKYLHDVYGDACDAPDMHMLEDAFRRELLFSGFTPKKVVIQNADDPVHGSSGLWHLEHRVDGKLIYRAYISPLTEQILMEMGGIIATTVLIACVLAFAFAYLLRVIGRQRTLDEMKDDFTSNMTHELKTPIAIAYAANDALLQFPDPHDEARTRRYLSAAIEQLTKLSGLVESILAMSMERRRRPPLNKERIELRPFLDSIAAQQHLKTGETGKKCRIEVSCSDSTEIMADPVHLSNIINNLIDNSIKYSGDEVTVSIFADADHISVTDNGIGIPARSLPFIFNKFYRVPGHNDTGGYGIGLFYVKTMVSEHGWDISAESHVGAGSTFTIRFSRQ